MRSSNIILIFLSLILIKCNTKTREETFITKKEYYDNGKIKSIYLIDTIGKGRGVSYHFYENGLKSGEVFYKGKKIDGVSKIYLNGKLTLEEHFVDGKKNGYSKNYDDEGKIFEEGEYLNDLEQGVWNYYYEDKLVLSELYKEGKLKEIIYKDTVLTNRSSKKVYPINQR